MTLALLLLLFQDGDANEEYEWEFEIRPTIWLGTQGITRLRTMEQEAIAKGGTGIGTKFRYEDLGFDGLIVVPELELAANLGPHQFVLGGLYAYDRQDVTLDRELDQRNQRPKSGNALIDRPQCLIDVAIARRRQQHCASQIQVGLRRIGQRQRNPEVFSRQQAMAQLGEHVRTDQQSFSMVWMSCQESIQ